MNSWLLVLIYDKMQEDTKWLHLAITFPSALGGLEKLMAKE
jgi:hypothetical protein